MQQAKSKLESQDATVELEIRPGEGHTIGSLMGGEEVFDFLESQRSRD